MHIKVEVSFKLCYQGHSKSSKLTQEVWHNRDSFSLFFNIIPLNINRPTLGPSMFEHCNPRMEKPHGPPNTPESGELEFHTSLNARLS